MRSLFFGLQLVSHLGLLLPDVRARLERIQKSSLVIDCPRATPKALGLRERFEDVLRAQERVPAEAVSHSGGVAAGRSDGTVKNGQRQTKRAKAAKEGKYTRGPAGNKEVGCGTLSFYDEEGERLATIRMARMPEVKKATLKVTLSKEVNSCLAERPDLKVVKVADGAKDNWTFLSGELPDGEEVIDFYHAAGHLDTALAVAYGDTHPKRSAQFKKLRHVLVEDDKGVEKVIRSLVHLRDTYPRRKKIARELKYFRRNRHRMRYAVLKKQGLPIGSGVTEAACKTLVVNLTLRTLEAPSVDCQFAPGSDCCKRWVGESWGCVRVSSSGPTGGKTWELPLRGANSRASACGSRTPHARASGVPPAVERS